LHKVVKDGDKNKLQERGDLDERKPIFLYRNFKKKKKNERRERERHDLEEEDGKKTSQQVMSIPWHDVVN